MTIDTDAPYWRLYRSHGEIVPVNLQWFDEHDYDQERFVNDTRYATRREAVAAIENSAHAVLARRLRSVADSHPGTHTALELNDIADELEKLFAG